MKKLLIALVLGIALVFTLATVASADNGPHGGFTATTDACAGCHRAHSARSGTNDLLRLPVSQLCYSCHESGYGASTDVHNGVYTTNSANGGSAAEGVVGSGLFGGGFTTAVMTTNWNGHTTSASLAASAISRTTTSKHVIDVAGQTVWGSGASNAAVSVSNGSTMTLECTSCHDPHGKAGYTNATTQTANCNAVLAASTPATESCTVKVASYRLLRWQPEGSNGFTAPATAVNWSGGAFPVSGTTTGWTVPDNYAANGSEWYTVGTQNQFAPNDYLAGGAVNNTYRPTTHDYVPAAINTGFFCAQCHDRYFNNSSLRNDTDQSTRCGIVGASGVTSPSSASDTHPTDAVHCTPSFTEIVRGSGIPVWHWADTGSSDDAVFMFRHASGDVRAPSDGSAAVSATAFTSAGRTCLTCHVSHGSAAVIDAVAGDGTNPGLGVDLGTISTSNVGGSLAGGGTLLRMDGRTLCLRCHASTVNFVTVP